VVASSAASRGKGYMMGLSTLQYKDSYGANVYRGGELNMPKRIQGILDMVNQPDYIQIITWVFYFPCIHILGF
jgi:glucan endo-1,3-alpha-glucosidase